MGAGTYAGRKISWCFSPSPSLILLFSHPGVLGPNVVFQVKSCTYLPGDNSARHLLRGVQNPDISISDISFHTCDLV